MLSQALVITACYIRYVLPGQVLLVGTIVACAALYAWLRVDQAYAPQSAILASVGFAIFSYAIHLQARRRQNRKARNEITQFVELLLP
jgi:uncharacterized protein (DUF486 family)